MQATASGTLSVYFYDTLAGSKGLEPTSIAARANPQVRSHARHTRAISLHMLHMLKKLGRYEMRTGPNLLYIHVMIIVMISLAALAS